MSCMLCQKSGRIFNVYENYGNTNHNVRDDLVEIYGVDAEPHLNPEDSVCNVCMNVLDSLAKLKKKLWPIICHSNQETKVKLGKIWEIFALPKEEEGSSQEPAIPCRTPTPSNLLSLGYYTKYHDGPENKISEKKRRRSLSRTSSGFGQSNASSTTGFSHCSPSYRSKTDSPLSEYSYGSSYTVKKTPTKKRYNQIRYDGQGRIIRKRTRSVSRAQEDEARYLELLESTRFYCNEGYCDLYFGDMDVLNHHRIMDHKILALYFCSECHKRYTISEHLKLHQRTHDTLPFLCLLCHCEVKNREALQAHLKEHSIYSVPCKYCDKSFLNKKICEDHFKSAHKVNRKRNVFKKTIILDQVNKEEGSRIVANNNKKSGGPEYVVHLIPYTDMESSEGDLDVTTENLNLFNVDFFNSSDESNESGSMSIVYGELSPIESVEIDM